MDHLLIVSDPSLRAMLAAERIVELVKELKLTVGSIHLVVNRVRNGLSAEIKRRIETIGIPLIGTIPEEEMVHEFDGNGRPLVELPDESSTVRALKEIADQLNI
jgi:CO dehydrogenase maturation factor